MLFMLPVHVLLLHVFVQKVFQSIAGGALGARACRGGMSTAVLGAGGYVVSSILAAAAFLAAARVAFSELRHKWQLNAL